MSDSKTIRIGGASGFWGDAGHATQQLLGDGNLDFIVYDYLAEITMSIMARARAKNPEMGYAGDFVSVALKQNLTEIANQGVKILSNAGGVNPAACGTAVRALVKELGLDLKVAVVVGDDLLARREEIAKRAPAEMFTGESFPDPDAVLSMNAYLGAFPVAKALNEGADIVITGRSVDSAVTLGACIHAFGWQAEDLDELAGGSLCGHILECGPQATGGNFTDWEEIVGTYENIGYPIAEVSADGTFITTKPEGTGGRVMVGTVAEQMLYEIGDPQAYFLPDVVCDFSDVTLEEVGRDRVKVANAKGAGVPNSYKVSTTFSDGFRGGTVFTYCGVDADKKARAFSDAVYARARAQFHRLNMPDFTHTEVEVIGAEDHYGDSRRIQGAREVDVKIAAKHPDQAGIAIMLREATGLALAAPPGLAGFAGNRAKPSPVVRLFSMTVEKGDIPITVDVDGKTETFTDKVVAPYDPKATTPPALPAAPDLSGKLVEVPLVALAWGRSGDKGDKGNIGIIARKAEYLPYIWAALDEAVVAKHFAHFLEGSVERFYMPGSNAINFLLHDVLGGGGVASVRNDPQGKTYAQLILDYPIPVPEGLVTVG